MEFLVCSALQKTEADDFVEGVKGGGGGEKECSL